MDDGDDVNDKLSFGAKEESMDDGDDVNDKLSFGAKPKNVNDTTRVSVMGEFLQEESQVFFGEKLRKMDPRLQKIISSSESKVLGQSGFPAYVSAGSGSYVPIRRIHRNGYGILKV
uniref:Uncharacterized protein n=1 Tax=Tanacetum cinerariifolium TaxID=118510 RepID=A0A6L2KS27_TANCI|nr:hypothetical protein [Tanacetum cinerariifolium]